MTHPALSSTPSGVLIRLKVVPGASRTKVSGILGDRLKVAVAAAPEAGKANQAVIKLISQTLGISERQVSITHGHTNPQKTVQIHGMTLQEVEAKLA